MTLYIVMERDCIFEKEQEWRMYTTVTEEAAQAELCACCGLFMNIHLGPMHDKLLL